MRRIYADGRLLADPSRDGYGCTDASIVTKTNDSGTLKLTLLPQNPALPALQPNRTLITVCDDARELWRGRLRSLAIAGNGTTNLTCNGPLDWLQDTTVLPQTISGTAAQQFAAILAAHNLRCSNVLLVGDVDVTAGADDIVVKAPTKTFAVLQTLLKNAGGYVRVRVVSSVVYVDYLAELEHFCAQRIRYGVNLTDCTVTLDASDLATALYAVGKNSLTVADANAGSVWVENEDAIARYGRIEDVYTRNDITDAAALLAAAQAELADRIAKARKISATAFDLSAIGRPEEKISAGDWCAVQSARHGVDDWLQVSQIDDAIFEPAKSRISLGAQTPAASYYLRRLLSI